MLHVEASTRPSLLLRMRNLGDRSAWGTFLDTYGPLVYGYARRSGMQDADAAEITQEVLCQVSRSIGTFNYQPQRGKFRGWLGAITRSKISQWRRRHRDPVQTGDDAALKEIVAIQADTTWDEHCNQHLLHLAMHRIRPNFQRDTWRAFELSWLEDRPAEEVAQALSCEVKFVYVAKSRILKRLREEVCHLAEDVAIIY